MEHYLHAAQRQQDYQGDQGRRWSMDAVRRPDYKRKRSSVPDGRLSWDHSESGLGSAPLAYRRPGGSQSSLSRSRSTEVLSRGPLTPGSTSRRSPAETARSISSRSNPPGFRSEWSFANSYVNSPAQEPSTLPASPQSRSRPLSASIPRDSILCSPLTQPQAWYASHPALFEEDDAAYRSNTPATVRPVSGALQPIMERASMDQDTSLADSSVFFYDRFRFSGVSISSEPITSHPKGSPPPIARVDPLTWPRYTDVSSHGNPTAGFKPKELIITRSPSFVASKEHRTLSRSSSVPLLSLVPAQPEERIQRERQARADLELARPQSSDRAYLASTRSFYQGAVPAQQSSEGSTLAFDSSEKKRDSTRIDETTEIVGDSAKSIPVPSSSELRHHRSVPAEIHIFRPSNLAALPVEEEEYGLVSRFARGSPSLSSPESDPTTSTLPQTYTSTVPAPPKHFKSSAEVEADQSLGSSSLSAPRSTASAATRSSETIHLVQWQVATTDSGGMRESEEIFRPLGLAHTLWGASSETGLIMGALASTAVAEEAKSRRSTLERMPETPLKGPASGMEWNKRPESDVGNGTVRAPATGDRIGLGITLPMPSIGQEASYVGYPAIQPSELSIQRKYYSDQQVDRTKTGTIPSQQFEKASLPSGMDRSVLELELEHGSIDGQNRRRAGEGTPFHDGTRSSSLRRHHQQGSGVRAVHVRHSTPRLDTIADHPARHYANDPTVDGLATPSPKPESVGVAGRADVEVTHRDTSGSANGCRVGKLHLCFLGTPLAIFLIIYQALFFTFEAPYLWIAISPALPLIAAALFVLLDALMIHVHLVRALPIQMLLCLLTLTILLSYCIGMSVLMIAKLADSPDRGVSAPGIHFDRGRSSASGKDAVQETLRDMPMPLLLAVIGILATIIGAVGGIWLWWTSLHRRQRDV